MGGLSEYRVYDSFTDLPYGISVFVNLYIKWISLNCNQSINKLWTRTMCVNVLIFLRSLKQKTSDTLSKRQEKGRLQHYKGDLLTKPAMMRYMEKCCRYAWKLVCQTPPYAIEGNHSLRKSVFDPNIHQLSREYAPAEHTGSGYIQLVLWPGLFDGSSGRVIRKTEVLLQSPCQ